MKNKLMLWAILFSAGLLMVIFRMNISRFISDVTALLVGGVLLAAVSGAGILIEMYRNKR
ncbi:MAG: hypothetical protein SOZ59_07650 [Candidatus Limivivens sp.]|nr:hypothetical protein [Candidatus Limivivens sp.]